MSEKITYWYCPHCQEEVHDSRVTYQELHDHCGYPVEIREVTGNAEPTKAQALADLVPGLVEALEELLPYFDDFKVAYSENTRDYHAILAAARAAMAQEEESSASHLSQGLGPAATLGQLIGRYVNRSSEQEADHDTNI